MKIKIIIDGPYVVSGSVPLKKESIVVDINGESVAYRDEKTYERQDTYSLCRCGRSKSKPYCDGTHDDIGFNGNETASREPYIEQARVIEGPDLILTDVPEICAYARFCHPGGKIWNLTRASEDPGAKALAINEAELCTSGRLIAWEKTTKLPHESQPEPGVSLIEDPSLEISGPIWVKGGIPVESSDGFEYEVRNRVTLCRCGESSNKPFCDGTHASCGFRDDI